MDLDDALGLISRRSGFPTPDGGSFNLKFPEIDFLADVAEHVNGLELLAEDEEIFDEKSKKRITKKDLYNDSKKYCSIIDSSEKYKDNVLMKLLSEKIKTLYRQVAGEPLYQKVKV